MRHYQTFLTAKPLPHFKFPVLLQIILSLLYTLDLMYFFVYCLDIDDCENTTCQHNGTCVDGVNDYSCTCVDGFTGWHCETGEL